VNNITQIEDTNSINRDIRAENLVKETRILNIARLAKMLVDLFGQDEPFKKVGKWAGQEIELYFKEWDAYITFILTNERENFDTIADKSQNPVSKISIKVKGEKVLSVFSKIVRSKNNLFGLIKLLKYIIPRKLTIKGSYMAALKLVRCLMIGKHEVYKKNL